MYVAAHVTHEEVDMAKDKTKVPGDDPFVPDTTLWGDGLKRDLDAMRPKDREKALVLIKRMQAVHQMVQMLSKAQGEYMRNMPRRMVLLEQAAGLLRGLHAESCSKTDCGVADLLRDIDASALGGAKSDGTLVPQ